jgi:hypothetical protein
MRTQELVGITQAIAYGPYTDVSVVVVLTVASLREDELVQVRRDSLSRLAWLFKHMRDTPSRREVYLMPAYECFCWHKGPSVMAISNRIS